MRRLVNYLFSTYREETSKMTTRINKYLSEVGYCSRREADRLIKEGKVTINGEIPLMGSQIDENDLVEALKDEKIAGVGLDVYDKEPLPQDHKLRFLPNALLLPHIGYVTAENYSKFYSQMIENLESCLENKPLRIIS